jgi:hypothetical protein
MRKLFAAAAAIYVTTSFGAFARSTESDTLLLEKTGSEKFQSPWYEKIQLRGYVQLRYNGLLETNPDLKCDQCDKSWGGDGGGFFFRRIRLVFSGQIHPQVYFYIQPDLASGGSNLAQIRDAYFI